MEYRGLYINHLDAFSVESAPQAVGSGTYPGSSMHLRRGGLYPGWDGLLNGPDFEQRLGFSEANTIGPAEDVWDPFVRPFAGQVTPYQPLGGIGAQVEIHPPTHVPGRGEYGLYCTNEREEEVPLSNGAMNREE